MELFDVVQTCRAYPSQWEARTADDRPVYIRYRHGWLSVHRGPKGGDMDEAVCGEELFGRGIGDQNDGTISWQEVARLANLTGH